MTQATIAAEIGSQRLFGRSTLLALRSMLSDLSNLLLSSVIVHFHPAARCKFCAGRRHFWRRLAHSRFTYLAMEGACLRLSARRRPQLGCNPVELSRAPGGARFSTRRAAGI